MDINDQTNFAATLASTDNMIKQRIADLSEEERTPVYDMYRVATTLLGETHLHRFRRYNLTQEVSMLTFHVRVLDLCVVETQRVHKECEQHGLNKSAFVVTSHETGPFWSQVEDDLEVTVDGVNTDFFWSVETQARRMDGDGPLRWERHTSELSLPNIEVRINEIKPSYMLYACKTIHKAMSERAIETEFDPSETLDWAKAKGGLTYWDMVDRFHSGTGLSNKELKTRKVSFDVGTITDHDGRQGRQSGYLMITLSERDEGVTGKCCEVIPGEFELDVPLQSKKVSFAGDISL